MSAAGPWWCPECGAPPHRVTRAERSDGESRARCLDCGCVKTLTFRTDPKGVGCEPEKSSQKSIPDTSRLWGYARVSTSHQSVHAQWDELVGYGVGPDNIRLEYASGAKHRPELVALVLGLSDGDTLVVSRLDRLGRNSRDLHELLAVLDEQNVRLVSLRENLDTAGIAGKLLVHLLAAIAEWERETIRERSKLGLRSAMARGVHCGRKPMLTPVEKRSALAWKQQGLAVAEIAKKLHCSRPTVYRALRELTKGEPVAK